MMATTIVRLCDIHMAKGDGTVNGDEVKIGLDGRWKTIDLCPDCHSDLLDRLREVWKEFGATPVDTPKPYRQRRSGLAASGSLGNGAGEGVNSAAFLAEQAAAGMRRGRTPENERDNPCPWCALDYVNSGALLKHVHLAHGFPEGMRQNLLFGDRCPACGEYVQQIGGHVSRMHGTTVPLLFRDVAKAGDPYGVVVEILAKAEVLPGGIEL